MVTPLSQSSQKHFRFPLPPIDMTHEWEVSAEGQAFIQRDNAELAGEKLYRGQSALVSRLHLRSFLRGWEAAIEYSINGDPDSPLNYSGRTKGQKPSSYSVAFMACIRKCQGWAEVETVIGLNDLHFYNLRVRELQQTRPEEFPNLGIYGGAR